MAQQVSADALLTPIYKHYYTDKRFPNLLFRNSPVGKRIEKNRIEGRDYNIAMLYSQGGATSGNYAMAVANAASSSRNAEMTIPPGNIFSVFNVTQKEILAARTKRGSYVKTLVNRMFAGTEGLRKMFAGCLYGFGYGDFGTLPATVATGLATMTLNYDAIAKVSLGTIFFVANGLFPNSSFYDATARTISAIDGQNVTWTGGVVGATPWAAGSYIAIQGGQDVVAGGGNPNMPSGLAAWLPYIFNRTGANWTTYIGTAFYGVLRNVSTNALSGWYYQRQGGEFYIDAVIQALVLSRRGGGVDRMIAINDLDYLQMISEVNQQTAMMQQINTTGAKNQPNEVARGVAKFRYAFSTSWLENLYDDPYCPKGYAWMLDPDVVEFACLSNVDKVINDGVPDNEPGAASVEQQDEPDTTFKLLIDDYLNIAPNSTSAEGPAAQVSLSLYGNFVVHEPGHNSVLAF